MHGYRRPAVRIGISGGALQLSSILIALYKEASISGLLIERTAPVGRHVKLP
jgi:hypothetical protein